MYFFDFRDDGVLDPDADGLDLPDLEAAKFEAMRALTGHARDVINGLDARDLAIEVRHHDGPIFRLNIRFEGEVLKSADD